MQQFVESFGLVYSPKLLPLLIHIAALLIVGLLTLRLIDSALKRVVLIVPQDDGGRARLDQRAQTLRQVVRSFGRVILGAVVILDVAPDLGVNLAPVVASAGIVGLAVGFGAQSLVKDVLAGFFVLLEDQYGVGDIVRIGTQEGNVEEMTLRVTVLRSGEGEVHVIPNGNVQTVTVLSRDWRNAVVDVSVARKEELDRVFKILNRVGESLEKDRSPSLLDKPHVVGVEKLTGVGVKIRVAARTRPLKHGEIEHEWRRRIKEAFDKEGIQMVQE